MKHSKEFKKRFGRRIKQLWADPNSAYHSNEYRKKKSAVSIETWKKPQYKKRMSLIMKGKNNPNWHKKNKWGHHTEETKKRLSQKAKERYKDPKNHPMWHRHHTEEAKLRVGLANKGRKQSEYAKQQKSLATKRLWKNPEYRQKISLIFKKLNKEKKFQIKRMSSMKISPNKPEKAMMQIIKENNFPFNFVGDGKVILGGFNPDFLSKNPKHIIEVFGDYWHNLPRYKELDKRKLKAYASLGYKTLVVWEHELKEPEKVAEKVRRFIRC